MYMGRASVGESLRRQAGDKLLTGAALARSDNVSCAKGGYASECGNVKLYSVGRLLSSLVLSDKMLLRYTIRVDWSGTIAGGPIIRRA